MRCALLKKMNAEQQAIVSAPASPLLVLAVAGAGKTRVVVERAKALFGSVLVCTFSKPAAEEIKRRISSASVKVATAHSLAYHLLHRPKIDEVRFKFIADRVRRDHHRHDIELDELLEAISEIKSHLAPHPDPSIASLYRAIEAKRIDEGVMTFDDLLLEAAHFNVEHHSLQFDHVIQDEAQDQNEVQEAFITSCVRADSYMAVGDPWQTIMEFRGARPEFISETNFKRRWPGAVVYRLSTNYRSGSAIVTAADAISEKRATAHRAGGVVYFTKFPDVVSEARAVAARHPTGAILFRRHYQSGVLEVALRQENVPFHSNEPYCSLGKVKPLLSYLWLAASRATLTDVRQSINKPFRFVSSKFSEQLGASPPAGCSWQDWVMRNGGSDKAIQWARLVDRLILLAESAAPVVIVKALIAGLGLENSQGLLDVATMYEDLDDLLDDLSAEHDRKGVKLSSIHAAKGLEWGAVHFVGWEKKPQRWDEEAKCYVTPPEEMRLNYVAFTRAKDELHVSSVEGE